MVSTLSSFQAQLASIMETLVKAAVLEISKLVDTECKVLLSEVTHSRSEISDLRKKLRLMELQPWTEHPQRQIYDDVRTNTEKTSIAKQHLCTADSASRTESVACIKSESVEEEILNLLDRCRDEVLSVDIPAARDQGDNKMSKERPQEKCEVFQPDNTIKRELHESDVWTGKIKSQHKNGEGTHVSLCGEAVKLSSMKDVERVPSVDTESRENHMARVSTTAESPELKRNVSPETTVNKVIQSSSKKFKSQTENTSFGHPQSLNWSKSIKTCSGSIVFGDKRFVCTFCSKRFRCFSQLEIHQRSHTGEKPYKCTLCGKRYTQKGHLYTHQRTHTGEKPYRCLLCGKGFIQKCSLDMHLRSHTGEKPFICTKCGKGFTKKFNLNKHLSCQSCNSIS